MKLYFSPGACSLAPHIVLQEIGKPFELEKVNTKTKEYAGGDYFKLNPKGSVPALKLDNGELLTENSVILQYLSDQSPEKELLPKSGTWERYRAIEWLNYVSTEVHKTIGILWRARFMIANDEGHEQFVRSTKENVGKRFDLLAPHLEKNKFMLGSRMSPVDAYLYAVVNWTGPLKISLENWPVLSTYMNRMSEQPSVQKAMNAEAAHK